MNAQEPHASPCLPPDRARQLVVALEHLGLETDRVEVVADPAITTRETSSVDRQSVARPALRVVAGLGIGAVLGMVVGLVVVAVSSALVAPTLIGLVIGGAVLGALTGLYSRLAMSTELADVDTGQDSMVLVDVSGLARQTVVAADELLARA